jgi:hypothetical protein
MSDEPQVELFLSSPNRYDKLTVEIQLERRRIAEVNQEKGIAALEVELFGNGTPAKLPLDTFIDALDRARRLLEERGG